MRDTAEPTTVCHLLQDVSFGGVESLITDLAAETTPAFDHHVCYFSDHDEGEAPLRNAGATVTKLEIPFDSPRSCFDPRSYPPIVRYLRAHDVDVVHTHYPLYVHTLGRIAAGIAGVDVVVGSYHNPRSDFHPVMQAVEVGTRSLATANVGVSGDVEESFDVPFVRSLPRHRPAGPVYNGIEVDSFAERVASADPSAVLADHDIPSDALIYLSVGRYDQQKRQVDLVEAMDRLDVGPSEAHLLLVGHGPLESTLRDRVVDLGLEDQVTITGRVDSVSAYYASGDVFVSSSAYEGFAIVFVEAMAAGLPIVGTSVPGTAEAVVEGRTGTLVPPERPDALAAAMQECTDERRRERFGRRGFERAAAEFDISTVAEEYAALYRGKRVGHTA